MVDLVCTLTFLLTLFSLSSGSSYPCAVRREIAPCTCRLQEPKLATMIVECEKMNSFSNIVDVLNNRFPIEQDIFLKVTFSHLNDLPGKSFKDLGMSVSSLNLNFDDLSYTFESSFSGLEKLDALSLADNKMLEVPRKTLRRTPMLKNLDLARNRISTVANGDFEEVKTLHALLMSGNGLISVESHALPNSVTMLHLGRNSMRDLNYCLRGLTDLFWLFINHNQLTSLEGQLPPEAPKLLSIFAEHNKLRRLPIELRNYPTLDTVNFDFNDIESLDKVFQRARRLKRLHLHHNKIHTLAEDEFAEAEQMDHIQLSHNHLKALNGAFSRMKRLRRLDLSQNHLTEFSLQEIRGLQHLKLVDLSHNRIAQLSGQMENVVELETRVENLNLQFNELTELNGGLLGIHGLKMLNLSNNKLEVIAPDDLIGLDHLRFLDIAFNRLKTLEETSKTFLPRLNYLIANNNYLTSLDKDFHGLPALCSANVRNNDISSIGTELGSKSRCKGSGGLFITLHGNPVLCHESFNKSAEIMARNLTVLQGDFRICPALTTTTTTTSTTTTTTTTTTTESPTTTEEDITIPSPIDLAILIRQPPPQVVPLLYSPDLLLPQPQQHQSENPDDQMNYTTEEKHASTTVPEVTTQQAEKLLSQKEFPQQIIPHNIVVLKDQGENLTLVIPMENGVFKKDHQADHYIQIDENDTQNQTKRAATITNIEIVDINPLPKDTSSMIIPMPPQERPVLAPAPQQEKSPPSD